MARSITLHRIVVSKAEINSLSSLQKKRLLTLTNMIRDLNVLQKCMLFAGQGPKSTALEKASFVCNSLFFLKTLISKAHEMYVFLQDDKIIKEVVAIKGAARIKESLFNLKSFFNAKNLRLFSWIRNKFGFHYEKGLFIEQEATKVMMNDDYELWLGEDAANYIFSSSSRISLNLILRQMQSIGFKGTFSKLQAELIRLTITSVGPLFSFCEVYLTDILLKGLNLEPKDSVVVTAPLYSEVELPFIICRDVKES